MQQALRGIVRTVGNKMSEGVRQNLTTTLLSFQSHPEVCGSVRFLWKIVVMFWSV
jgi:hypothetical protein